MRKSVLILFVSISLLGGCGKSKPVGPVSVYHAPGETVLVKIGDRSVTVADFRNRLAFETGIFGYTMNNSANKPKNAQKRLELFERQRLRGILPQLVHCALLDAYLDSSCGGRDVKEAEKAFEKAVRRLMPKAARTNGIDGLSAAIGLPSAYVGDQILVSDREEKARRVFEPASDVVSEKEIDEGLARMEAYTARAIASNCVIRVTASNVFARVKAGENFVKLGEAFGDAGGEATEWATFERDELENVALRNWAFAAKVGEIGGPFELDDGVSIVKVLEKREGTATSSLASAQTAEVKLARISIPMIEENPEPKTRQHCREALLAWKAQQAKDRLFEKLFGEAKISYPNGDKLDFKK